MHVMSLILKDKNFWEYFYYLYAIKTVQIPNNHRLVSFDVKSLFTSIPLQLALDCTGTLLQQTADDTPLPLPNDKIMDLLKLCLESTFFRYNGRHYKQLHGTAMGSPVSVVVAEIVMHHIEKRALATCDQTLHFWFRYVDDTITILQTDDIDVFHGHLNRQNSDIQFTRELEANGKIPFLECLVSRDDTRLRTTVYRKPTLLDRSSYNPTSQCHYGQNSNKARTDYLRLNWQPSLRERTFTPDISQERLQWRIYWHQQIQTWQTE